ncbi:MAG TPA: Rieske 2Fe-2S domain-containing protein [Acidimicrobiales bacterium]|nr:Rieske 2Fe-2S domain-containing protein [Acidimicrobiales bacterium]
MVLRAFLGVTFTFAGLQKLANPGFFQASSPGSFEQQLHGSILTSPLHHLLDPALHAPVAVALVIACAELAVGLGTLAGILARVAALGGMALSLTFFLTVSFNDSPYYYGSDIVFFFAWTTLVLGGAGPLSLDALIARRATVAADPSLATAGADPALGRRLALRRLVGAGAVGAVAVVAGSLDAAIGRLVRPGSAPGTTTASRGAESGPPSTVSAGTRSGAARRTISGPVVRPVDPIGSGVSGAPVPGGTAGAEAPATTTPATSSVPPHSTPVLSASQVPVGGAAAFLDPAQQIPAYAVQPKAGDYRAFSRICTHAGCTVAFDQPGETFVCPCHGSIYSAATGAVIQGPAPLPLPEIAIARGKDGRLYAD